MFETCSSAAFSGALPWESRSWENGIWTERETLTCLCTYLVICTDPFSMVYRTRWCWISSWLSSFSSSVFRKLSRWFKMKVESCMIMWSWRQRKIVRREHIVRPQSFIKINSLHILINNARCSPFICIILKYVKSWLFHKWFVSILFNWVT